VAESITDLSDATAASAALAGGVPTRSGHTLIKVA